MARNIGDKNLSEREKIRAAQRKADLKKFAARQSKDKLTIARLEAKCEAKDVKIMKLEAKIKRLEKRPKT